jgi:hypothetical protein
MVRVTTRSLPKGDRLGGGVIQAHKLLPSIDQYFLSDSMANSGFNTHYCVSE